MKKEIETYRGTIYPWQCDFNNHLNVQFYVAKFDEATWQFFSAIGITNEYLKLSNRGMVAVEQTIKYYKEILSGDIIHIKTTLLELKNKGVIFNHKMFNSETEVLVSETILTGIQIDNGTRRSIPFPKGLILTN